MLADMRHADAALAEAVVHHATVAAEVRTTADAATAMVRDLAASDRREVPRLARAVLVLDDDEAARWALAVALRHDLGVVVYEAATTSQASDVLSQHHPAVIVCDWSLRAPGRLPVSGLRWLLSVGRCYRACLVSGHDDVRSLARECRTANVRAFLRPVTMAQTTALTSHVRALLDEAAPVAPVSP